MKVTKQVKNEMLQRFQDQYGIMKPALHYSSPFELMIAVILSAQCTDERVNIVTAAMFPEYNTPEKMLTLGLTGLEEKSVHADSIIVKQKIFWLIVPFSVNNITEKCRVHSMNWSNFLAWAARLPTYWSVSSTIRRLSP